jgi:hypothetical protein
MAETTSPCLKQQLTTHQWREVAFLLSVSLQKLTCEFTSTDLAITCVRTLCRDILSLLPPIEENITTKKDDNPRRFVPGKKYIFPRECSEDGGWGNLVYPCNLHCSGYYTNQFGIEYYFTTSWGDRVTTSERSKFLNHVTELQ